MKTQNRKALRSHIAINGREVLDNVFLVLAGQAGIFFCGGLAYAPPAYQERMAHGKRHRNFHEK
jgi:glucokinase